MIDLTPLDVRKKKGDFRRTVRGYDPELVDDFLDMVAERLEELVKQNVGLTERAEHLQEQVASYREREKALNEALVTAQQLRSEAQAQADKEVELIRREAKSQAERIIEDGQRSYRELAREIEALHARKLHFLRSFRTMLERYLGELNVQEVNAREEALDDEEAVRPASPVEGTPRSDTDAMPPSDAKQEDWLSSLAGEGQTEDVG